MIGNYLNSPRHNKNVWQALAGRLPAMGWTVITTSTKESQVLRLLDMLFTILRKKNQYDLAQIDVFSGNAFIFAESCARLLTILKKPIVLTLHGGGLPSFARRHPKRVAGLLSLASVVVTPSPYLRQRLAAYDSHIRVIHNGIDISSIPYKSRTAISPTLIWIRAFHQTYNPELAVKVLFYLLKDYPDASLTMVGPDKGDGSMQAVGVLAVKMGVEKHLKIMRPVPYEEVPALLGNADLFINTTNYDTAPRSLLEAMANGACVVSTDVGGIPWMVTSFRDGILVPPEEAIAMTAAIKKLLSNPELAERVSKTARQTAEGYDWSNVMPEWDDLFTEVLERACGKN